MQKYNSHLTNLLGTAAILTAFFGICLFLEDIMNLRSLTPAIFTLAVFLVSRYSPGYIYGLIASAISVLAVNFAFTFPYFRFNFTIPENLISAIIMLIVTIMTSTLTTQIKQQEKIRSEIEREKMRANLLRAVSHDLRTPLTTIYGSSSAVIENYDNLTKEQKLQLTNGIKEDAEWLMGMVENLLSVTRVDKNNVSLKKTPTVLEELIDTVLVRFRKQYPSQDVIVEIPDDFISIPMDAVLIQQVLFNILQNAVQHAKGMTRLILRVSVSGDFAIFEVIDNGCGIPKDRIKSIFTGYFEQKEIPVDHQKNCMGIGLSVCASIIKAHDGEIQAENRKDGGCCFRFSLNMEESCNE